jgi:hypothetical protein
MTILKNMEILEFSLHCIPTKNIYVKQQTNQQCTQTSQTF